MCPLFHTQRTSHIIGGSILAKERIYLYHTNDLHANFHFWPRIRKELLKRQAKHEEASELALTFDVGDAADRAHPLIEATEGRAMTHLFNEAKILKKFSLKNFYFILNLFFSIIFRYFLKTFKLYSTGSFTSLYSFFKFL